MTRLLYSMVLWMHPPTFKHRFGDEMLSIFDEGGNELARYLLLDGILSLFRQWLVRSSSWKVFLALAGAFIQVWGFGMPTMGYQHWERNQQPVTPYLEELMLIALALICVLFIMVMSLTLWTIRFRRHLAEGSGIRRATLVTTRLFELE